MGLVIRLVSILVLRFVMSLFVGWVMRYLIGFFLLSIIESVVRLVPEPVSGLAKIISANTQL